MGVFTGDQQTTPEALFLRKTQSVVTSIVLRGKPKSTLISHPPLNDLAQYSKLIVTYRILWKSAKPTGLVAWSLGGASEAFLGHALVIMVMGYSVDLQEHTTLYQSQCY